jgi:ABC-type transport system substrate-binding protein
LKILNTPSARREVQVIKDILKRNLNIDIELDTKDFPVLIDEFDRMDWDLTRLGSGGDYDPDDGVVDWMQTSGFFSDAEVDRLIDEQRLQSDPQKRKEMVQRINKITSDKVASAFVFHPIDAQVRHKSVNFPAESRIPGLVDLDRTTIS